MEYYIANAVTYKEVVNLGKISMSTMDYISLVNKYPQLQSGEYILLSRKKSNSSFNTDKKYSNKSFFDSYCGNSLYNSSCEDDEDEEFYLSSKYANDEDEYGDETVGWHGPAKSERKTFWGLPYDDEDDERDGCGW